MTSADTSGHVDGRVTVNIVQAAARCGVARRTIYNWLAQGKLEFTRTAGGAIRIFEDTLFQRDAGDAGAVTDKPQAHKRGWAKRP